MTEYVAEPLVKQIEHGDVRELRMNRPPVNAFTGEFLGQLRTAIERATQEEMKGIVLSGSPGRFSAGFDLPFLLGLDRKEIAKTWQELYGLLRTIAASQIPIVAAMTGHAIAGGTVIAMFCDRRVMAAGDYKLGLNEVQVGIHLPPVVLACLRRLVGSRVAEYLAVMGPLLCPQKALEFGLVDELHEPDFVVNRAVEWCQRVVALPEAAMSTRHNARADLVALFENALQPEQDSFTTSWFSPSTQKHVRAAVERLGKSAAKG
jgi:3,2-trans-enoyl-CoA isomerase